MAAIPPAGRGRGRGRGAIALASENRPGAGTVTSAGQSDPMDQLTAMVKSLDVTFDDSVIMPVSGLASKLVCENKPKEVMEIIYQRCYEDWRWSRSGAAICKNLISQPACATAFRTELLLVIQTDYKNKDKLREESAPKFLGYLAFLCQVMSQLRDQNGQPFRFLAEPIIESVQLCLDKNTNQEQMECALDQLFTVGKLLHELTESIKLRDMKNAIRDRISGAFGSKEVRLQFIMVLEGFASDWRMYADGPPKEETK